MQLMWCHNDVMTSQSCPLWCHHGIPLSCNDVGWCLTCEHDDVVSEF